MLLPRQSWLVSLAFWLSLLFSAALYAAVALSPKLLAMVTLNQQREENQLRLVAVEKQVQQLQKVIEALKHDPSFAKELARTDFETAPADEHRIPVDTHLSIDLRSAGPNLSVTPSNLPWYAPLLNAIGNNRKAGNTLLTIAALLVLYAFTFLQERRSSGDAG